MQFFYIANIFAWNIVAKKRRRFLFLLISANQCQFSSASGAQIFYNSISKCQYLYGFDLTANMQRINTFSGSTQKKKSLAELLI